MKDGKDISQAIEIGLKNVCVVCRLFGCTGWKRRFSLIWSPLNVQEMPFWLATIDEPNKIAVTGDMKFKFRFTRGYEYYQKVLQALLTVMSNFGAIGAKSQYGFGVFSYPGACKSEEAIKMLQEQIESIPESEPSNVEFYTLRNFWCLQCHIPEDDPQINNFQQARVIGDSQTFHKFKSRLLPVSFDIRYKLTGQQDKGLRQTYRVTKGKQATRKIFGTVINEDQKWGSRIFVSHLYKNSDSDTNYQLRVWGFTESGVCETVEDALRAIFKKCELRRKNGQDILTMTEVVE